ncbi:MAG: regulatory protein RecX [Bdellovibrionaceae bacterium]|nr:regulatory protein RecX [Pseudobdellovibrionaceae bacterium]
MSESKSAREKTMDYLAIREHSRLELETKLKKHNYSNDDIQTALDHAEKAGWLQTPQALALKVSENLHSKNKSYFYIEEYLNSKGLPPVPRDSERELEKAQILLKSQFSKLSKSTEKDKKQQALRFLQNRGFDSETISKACPTDHFEDEF